MKVVIDIDEEMISLIKAKSIECFNVVHYGQVLDAIYNGTIIPKGHGRLIDADMLDKDCESSEYHEVITSWLDLAPTIIESNKGE